MQIDTLILNKIEMFHMIINACRPWRSYAKVIIFPYFTGVRSPFVLTFLNACQMCHSLGFLACGLFICESCSVRRVLWLSHSRKFDFKRTINLWGFGSHNFGKLSVSSGHDNNTVVGSVLHVSLYKDLSSRSIRGSWD